MTSISKGRKNSAKLKSMGNREEYLNRITKTLYYAKLPVTDCLSLPVTEIAAELFTEVKNGKSLERLDVEEASRISRNACVSPCSLVLALLYLERLKDCNPEYLQKVAPSELFLVSLVVAGKFLNDDGEDDEIYNKQWARSGSITLSHINKLEKEFLKAIDWDVFVQDKDFWDRLHKLEKEIAYKEAQKRGWFSYTDLNCLMNSMQLLTVANTVINVSSICLTTYAAGIAALLGSAIVTSHLPGTFLSQQQSNVSSTEIEFTTAINKKSPIIDFREEEILMVNEVDEMLQCNESCEGYQNIAHDNKEGDASWKWWLNSIMTWLPQYSALELESKLVFDKVKIENTGAFAANTKFLFDPHTEIKSKDKSALRINWKEILCQHVQYTVHNSRHYASYITKCF